MTNKNLIALIIALFVTPCIVFTHVLDLEFVDPYEQYQLERRVFEQNRDFACNEFMPYGQWMEARDHRQDLADTLLARVGAWLLFNNPSDLKEATEAYREMQCCQNERENNCGYNAYDYSCDHD